MASACVNNLTVVSPETNFHPTPPYSPYVSSPEIQDTAAGGDFEFRLEEDPVTMLPADELFSDGKLVPLHFSAPKHPPPANVSSLETPKSRRRTEPEVSGKAPKGSSKWREILGLRKSTQQNNTNQNPKSLKQFLKKSSSSTAESSLSLPLLKDNSDNHDSVPRLSLSSSSSTHEDLPRLSLDSDNNNKPSFSPNPFAPSRIRMVKPKPNSGSDTINNNQTPVVTSAGGNRSSDSPRMNSSGKIMFQSLERSSSSPSSFNGGRPKLKQRGIERSYSANVRVSPVLNVFGFFSSSSPQKNTNSGRNKTK
ncbi:hypothetical protein J1N35_009381 [Gossypium stocksii]|uniref:Uncharacterized protein n=1 Tax=Gossypium stocksii TaxID=47602 RepID=A0A9D4ABC3_9ROSI|nr:hypothetical protein J1N35_009381 [Gossypium stocksii]